MTTIMNDNTLNDKIDYKIDLQSSSKSVSNMSNMDAKMNTTTSGTDKTQKIDYKIDLQSSSNSVSNTSNMNANMNATDNSQKIESKISNILIDKKDLKSNSISNIYKDEMTDFQLNDEITFDYETKKNLQGGVKITIEKITPKYINNYKKENMKNIKKIDLKCEEDADDTNNEDMEEQQHQEQMNAHGYSKCAYCEKELPNNQIGEDDDGDYICIGCNNAKNDEEEIKSDDEEEEEGEVWEEEIMEGMIEKVKAYQQKEKEEIDETLIQKLQKEKEIIEAKIAEEKYKNEAGMRKEKVKEYFKQQKENEYTNTALKINEYKTAIAEMEQKLNDIEKCRDDDYENLLSGFNIDAVYETITKKKNKTKSGVRKTKGGNGNTTANKYKAEDIFKDDDKLRQVIDGKEFKGIYYNGEFKDQDGKVFKSLRKWNIHNKEQTNIKSIPDCWTSFKVLNEQGEWVRIAKNIENIPDDK